MVARQLGGRGLTNERTLDAFGRVPREAFLPPELAEFAYQDSPLPIGSGQTISQPYVVALMIDALGLQGHERVLEIGTGSGYSAALLSLLAGEVFTIERQETLAEEARERLEVLGYSNVRVRCGDGTLGWPEQAPFEAIVVAAGGPVVPEALLSQLADGGRLVIPVGATAETQELVRVVRHGRSFRRETLSQVRFVPLIGEQGWSEPGGRVGEARRRHDGRRSVGRLIRECAEPLDSIEEVALDSFLDRVGDCRVVLLGEATHGTSEFYSMRARITKELIERRGFDFVAVEADWPDAAKVDAYVLDDAPGSTPSFTPFARFPEWMWRNEEVHDFVEWLRARNRTRRERRGRAGFHGLDLYSMFTSIACVLRYLDDVDPDAAHVARERYGLLTPWQRDPAAYGRAVLSGRYRSSENAVIAMLREMLDRRLDYARRDGERFFDAAQNARVVADAERYYRALYYGQAASWNLRDTHMFETLASLLAYYGEGSRGIVWEHNSHVGDALATEMSARGEINVGQLCRGTFGESAYIVGFGTDHGTVAAASGWDEPMQVMQVRPARTDSYESLFHESGLPALLLPLRRPFRAEVVEELMPSRLERAIGVVYRPEAERASHYFEAILPRQFDELVWFDETRAVRPLAPVRELPPARAVDSIDQ
jgi:protein-L-isoaspartate(D-aspartate) O-methyltransferase